MMRALIVAIVALGACFAATSYGQGVVGASAGAQAWFPIANYTAYPTELYAAVVADGWSFFTTGYGGDIRTRNWNVVDGSSTGFQESESGSARHLAFHPGGFLALQAYNGSFLAFNTTNGEIALRFLSAGGAVAEVAWLNESTLVVADNAGAIVAYGPGGTVDRTFRTAPPSSIAGDPALFLAVGKGGAYLGAGIRSGTVVIWSTLDGSVLYQASVPARTALAGVFVDSYGYFVWSENGGRIHWISTATWTEALNLSVSGDISALAPLPGWSTLLVGSKTAPYLRGLDLSTGSELWVDNLIAYPVDVLDASPTGAWFITASHSRGVVSAWAQRTTPWLPPAAPMPVVTIQCPPEGSVLELTAKFCGTTSPAGAATHVLWAIGDLSGIAQGVENWTFDPDLRGLEIGYHEARVWAAGSTVVGPVATLGFFVSNASVPEPGNLEIEIANLENGSSVAAVGMIAGHLSNASEKVMVYVRVAAGPWHIAQADGNGWAVSIEPAHTIEGLTRIEAIAFDAVGRIARTVISVVVQASTTPNLPPTVSILSPANGSNVSFPFEVKGITTDEGESATTLVWIENLTRSRILTAAQWNLTFESTDVAPDWYVIWAIAIDESGNRGVAAVRVFLRPEPHRANLEIRSPAEGAEQVESIWVAGEASNFSRSARIDIKANGEMLASIPASEVWGVYIQLPVSYSDPMVLTVELWEASELQVSDVVNLSPAPRPPAPIAAYPVEWQGLGLFLFLLVVAAILYLIHIGRLGRS